MAEGSCVDWCCLVRNVLCVGGSFAPHHPVREKMKLSFLFTVTTSTKSKQSTGIYKVSQLLKVTELVEETLGKGFNPGLPYY